MKKKNVVFSLVTLFLLNLNITLPSHAQWVEQAEIPELEERMQGDNDDMLQEITEDNNILQPTPQSGVVPNKNNGDDTANNNQQERPAIKQRSIPTARTTQRFKLRGLNKITARQSVMESTVGLPISFGNLTIYPKECWKSSPEEYPESKILLDIWEQKPNEENIRIFYGWMLASSPGLVSLEHPVYDINILQCLS